MNNTIPVEEVRLNGEGNGLDVIPENINHNNQNINNLNPNNQINNNNNVNSEAYAENQNKPN